MGKILNITLSPKQAEAVMLLYSDECKELLFGGGKGGAKTCLGVRWVFGWVKWLAKFFDLRPSNFPPVLGFMGRKRAVDFSTTALNTWKRDIPSDAYVINEQKKLIIVENLAAIQYGGFDDENTIQKFNSAEYAFGWIEQPDECSQSDVGMLRATMRFKLKGKEPPYKLLLTPNPVISDDPDLQWLKDQFIDNPTPSRKFLKALYTDNPYLPVDYGKTLDEALAFNPALLKAYKEGSWDQIGFANVVIPRSLVMENVDNKFPFYDQFERRITVADIASGGDDETVIYDMINSRIANQEIYKHVALMDTCGRIQAHAKANGSTLICVDKVGEGSGVFSRLEEIFDADKSMMVYGFDSRISPPQGIADETYANYRAYAWFNAAKRYFVEHRANVPNDPILISQLSGVKFNFRSNGKQTIEGKEDIKARTGRSPDRADTYIMGLDALDYAKPIETGLRPHSKVFLHPSVEVGLRRQRNPYEGRALQQKDWEKLQASRR